MHTDLKEKERKILNDLTFFLLYTRRKKNAHPINPKTPPLDIFKTTPCAATLSPSQSDHSAFKMTLTETNTM